MKNQNVLKFNGLTLRRIIIFLALIGMGNLYAYQLSAQVICDQAFTARDSSILSPVNQQASTSGITYIKLYFHAYHAVFLGQQVGVDIQRCRDMRDSLNDQFEGTGFQFFFNECEFEVINDNWLAVQWDFEEIGENIFCVRNHDDGIDIHVRPDLEESNAAEAESIGGGELVLGGYLFLEEGDPRSLDGDLAHEMGHCLGLFHTFQGTCPTDLNSVRPNCNGETIMLPAPSEGDLVGDTPEDARGGIDVSNYDKEQCIYDDDNPQCQNGNFTPHTKNFMAYYTWRDFNCQSEFTPGQIAKMQRDALPSVQYDHPNSH